MILFIYLIAVNLISAAICAYDKSQARIYGRRVSEHNIWVLSLIGGAPAMYLTMHIIHHKTRKKKFMIGIPVIIAVELAAAIFILLN